MIHGPRHSSSPTASPSHGHTEPSSAIRRASTPAMKRPWVTRLPQSSRAAPTEPSGDVSVMPQAWMILTP